MTAGSGDLQALFDELCLDTLSRQDPAFVHQHAVDAFTVQQTTAETKPIAVVFALAGLFLAVEKGWNGREVQRAHMRMAARRRGWVAVPLPAERGGMTVADVLAVEGAARDRRIGEWCREVWSACEGARAPIAALLRELQIC